MTSIQLNSFWRSSTCSHATVTVTDVLNSTRSALEGHFVAPKVWVMITHFINKVHPKANVVPAIAAMQLLTTWRPLRTTKEPSQPSGLFVCLFVP